MSDLFSGKPLELEVTNFGPIAEAKIDLRPLTVFVGPSNTGKSYLAILVYALHRFFGNSWQLSGILDSSFEDREFSKKLSGKMLRYLGEWTDMNLMDREKPFGPDGMAVPDSIADLIRPALAEFDSLGASLGSEINRCFGIAEAKELIRKGSKNGASVVIRRHLPDESATFTQTLQIKTSQTKLSTNIPEHVPVRLYELRRNVRFPGSIRFIVDRMLSAGVESDKDAEQDAKDLIRNLADFAVPHVVGLLSLPGFYLPSDRTGVMHSHAVMVSSLIKSATAPSSVPTPTSMLSGVLGDFLEQLVYLGSQSNYPRSQKDLLGISSQIEKSVLGGRVHAKKSESGYPFFAFQPAGWKDEYLSFMNVSSMISELAPVVLYLRHIVRKESVLIIEEPESHLHPAMQVEFTRQLAAIVHSGVRVIVTTHSEWLLEELANLVQLSELSPDRRSGIKHGGEALSPNDVGVWLFEPKHRSKGSVVKKIPLNESGLFPSGFSEVASALHNNWAEISSQVEKNQ